MIPAPPTVPRTVDDYIELLRAFAERRIEAKVFQRRYFDLFQNDATFHPTAVFGAIEDVFFALDDFYEDPALRDPGDLDEAQLLERAESALGALRALPAPV